MKAYPQFVIYYFSGTGNSHNVALWMADAAKANGIEAQIINIADIDRLSIAPPPANALVIFVSPIHGFNYPPVMLHFIARFPKGKNSVLLMNTRAGMLIGKFITPGLTGIAFYFSALLLRLKGYRIVGMVPVDLPSNWISIHPGLNQRTVKYLHERNKVRVNGCATRIIAGKTDFRGVYEIIQDLIIAPFSLAYYFAGRFFFAKTYYASGDCNNCDSCINNCPVKAIIKVDERPFWTFDCECCMKCMSNCPKKAIETAHGAAILFMVFYYTLFLTLFYHYFNQYFFVIENGLLRMVIETGIFLLLMGLWYRIIHYAMRFKLIQRIIVYTSLTKYKFWGPRYKAIKEK